MVCGLIVGSVLLTLGISGSLLAFKDQLDLKLHPTLLGSSQSSREVTTDYLISATAAEGKNLRPLLIDFSTQPAAAIYLSHGSWFPSSGVLTVFVDRGTGRVRGSRLYNVGTFNRLMHLHTELFLGGRGANVLGGLALVLIAMTSSGYFLWWPGVERWRRATQVEWSARWLRLNWDLHNAFGFFVGPFLLLQASSALGLTMLLPSLTATVPRAVAEITRFNESPRSNPAESSSRVASLQPMVLESLQHHPGMQLKSVALPVELDDPVVITLGDAHYVDRGSQARLAFDRYSGALLSDRASAHGSLLLRLYLMLEPLHCGRIAGVWSQVLWSLLGFVPALLFITGFTLWWRRVPSKHLRGKKVRPV
jgi:uncharacterized iron-regulated membrane protein